MTCNSNPVVRPFANAIQFLDWTAANCERCKKATWYGDQWNCDIQKALDLASVSSGEITPQIAMRMGYDPQQMLYNWPCTEVEWTEEWKAEWKKRHDRANGESGVRPSNKVEA